MAALAQLQTPRLRLLALDATELRLCLEAPERLKETFGVAVSRAILDDNVRRAIAIKLAKLPALAPAELPWATYWLLVLEEEAQGIGLAGFNGAPDGAGEAEIGYGVDPGHRCRGYAAEAIGALLDWAFEHAECRAVIARGVRRDNAASRRVLARLGMRLAAEGDETLEFVISAGAYGARSP
jgi:ribosomal-protein-alanine N-acetyltransferase